MGVDVLKDAGRLYEIVSVRGRRYYQPLFEHPRDSLIENQIIDFTQIVNAPNIIAGTGLAGGGNLSDDVQIWHDDTSSVADTNNANGSVVQNLSFDEFGHTTAVSSVNLDDRYYTETEIDNLLANYVPYTGATGNVNLGIYGLTASTLDIGSNLAVDSNSATLALDTSGINTLDSLVTKEYVDLAVTSLGASYYMHDTDDPTGYKTYYLNPSSEAEVYIEATGLVDDDYIGGWISAGGEAPQKLLKGVYDWFITAEKVAGTQTLRLYWKLFEKKSDGTEVEIATSTNSNEIEGRATYLISLQLDQDYIPESGSRIVGKIYADVSGSGNAPSVRIYYQGGTSSRWEIPASSEIFQNIFVPYTGAVKDLDLGSYSITAGSAAINGDGSFSGDLTVDGYATIGTTVRREKLQVYGGNIGVQAHNNDPRYIRFANSAGSDEYSIRYMPYQSLLAIYTYKSVNDNVFVVKDDKVGIRTSDPGSYTLNVNGTGYFAGGLAVDGNLTVSGNLNITGDIYQQGEAYETHAEHLYTSKDMIYTRDGATAGLGVGEYTGIQAIKYDGVNDGQLVFDKDGWARVGDVGDLQKLATIEESPVNGGIAFYNTIDLQLQTSTNLTWDGNKLLVPNVYLSGLTDGYVPYQTASGLADSGIYYDSVNDRVGIGTTSPAAKLEVKGSGFFINHAEGSEWLSYYNLGENADPNPGDIILLIPNNDGTVKPNFISGILTATRGDTGAYRSHKEWYIAASRAYNSMTASIMPLTQETAYIKFVTFDYNGVNYLGIDTSAIGLSSHRWTFHGRWLNMYNLQKPTVLSRSACSNITDYKTYQAVGGSIFINSAGNVGIGTTSPSVKLHVKGSDRVVFIEGDEEYSGGRTGQLRIQGSSDTNKAMFVGYDTTNNFGFIGAHIAGVTYSNLSLNPSGGNVGIGTTGPDSKLTVVGGDLRLGDSPQNSHRLYFSNSSGDKTKYIATEDYWLTLGAHINEGVRIKDNNATIGIQLGLGSNVSYFNTGNVVIGATDPQGYKLYVNGTGYFNDDLVVNDLLESSDFVSGIFGSGWRIDKASSYLEIDNIMVRNTLQTHIFQKDIVKALNGYEYVSDSGIISEIDTDNSKVYFADDKSASFNVGDQLWVKDIKQDGNIVSVKFTITEVGSSASGQTDYTVTVDEGSLSDLEIGLTAVRISSGAILLDASSMYSPFVDIISEGEELATDGGLENWNSSTDLTNWHEVQVSAGVRDVIQESTIVHSGSYSAKLSATNNDGTVFGIRQTKTFTVGRTYRMTIWLYAESYNNGFIKFGTINTSWGWENTREIRSFELSNWKRYDLYFTATGNEMLIAIYYYSETNGAIYIDDISVKEVSVVKSRFGNLSGISNCSGYGIYGTNTYLTDYLLVGDLTKAGEYMEYTGGNLNITGAISNTTGAWSLNRDGSGSLASGNISWNTSGDASFTGTITAGAGEIGGWTIGTDKLYKNNIEISSTGYIKAYSGGTTYWSLNDDGSGLLAQGKISWNADGSGSLGDGKISWDNIGNLTVDGSIVASGINADNITTGTLSADRIGAGTITGDKIAGSTITADKLNVSQLSSISADVGTITAGVLEDDEFRFIIDLYNAIMTINDTATDRIKIGIVDTGTYGIRGFDGSGNAIFELSNNANFIGGWGFDNAKLYSGDFEIDGTGKTIKTATSGKRIEIDGANHRIGFYNTYESTDYGIGFEASSNGYWLYFMDINADRYVAYLNKNGEFRVRDETGDNMVRLVPGFSSYPALVFFVNSEVAYDGYLEFTGAEFNLSHKLGINGNLTVEGNLYANYIYAKSGEVVNINDDVSVTGNVSASGTISPTRSHIPFGYAATIDSTGTYEMETVGGATNGQGYRMVRAGKITGISLQFDLSSVGDVTTATAKVCKNGSATTLSCTINFGGGEPSGDYGVSSTGSVSFNANDRIDVKLEVIGIGPFSMSNVAVLVEIET